MGAVLASTTIACIGMAFYSMLSAQQTANIAPPSPPSQIEPVATAGKGDLPAKPSPAPEPQPPANLTPRPDLSLPSAVQGEPTLPITSSEQSSQLRSSKPNARSQAAYRERGVTFYRKGLYSAAFNEFSEGIAISPKNAALYVNRAVVSLTQDNDLAALRDLCNAIRIDPSFGAAYAHRAVVFGRLGQATLAANDLLKAKQLNYEFASMLPLFKADLLRITESIK
jgi:tetratricopeptide (TPR) repeat protein